MSDLKSKLSDDLYRTLLEDVTDNLHQTQFYKIPHGFVFILRSFDMSSDKLSYLTEHFICIDGCVYTYSIDKEDFEVFRDNISSFLEALHSRFNSNKKILLLYTNELEKMEDNIFDRKIPVGFMDNWFDLKKDISRFERFFTRQLFSYKDFYNYGEKDPNVPSIDLNNLIADIQFTLNMAEGSSSRLDNLHNYYNSVKDDKVNKNIYFLTLLSGIFLPLNLVVGFFGMNTENLFFKENPKGTLYVVYILAAIFITLFIGINLIKVLDKLVLRWLLGRTSIYKKISKKIAKLEDKWSI